MTANEPEKTIQLQFRAMSAPVTVSVPTSTLRYLDLFADRCYDQNEIVYRQTDREETLPEFCPPRFRPTLLAA